MTYEDVVSWIFDNFDFADYDTWDDYITAVDYEFEVNAANRAPATSFLPQSFVDDIQTQFEASKTGSPVITEQKVFGTTKEDIGENIPVIDESRTTGTLPPTPSYQEPKVAKKSLLSSVFKYIKELFD